MKKIRKMFAVLLVLVMVLGMSVTTLAENGTATITVKNIAVPDLENGIGNATVEYTRIIEPAPISTSNKTGWQFTDEKYATAYKEAYGKSSNVEAIQALLDESKQKQNIGTSTPEDGAMVTDSLQARSAISKASAQVASWSGNVAVSEGNASWSVSNQGPGLYIIKIEQTGYNYLAMAAYVGFGQVELDSNNTATYPTMYSAILYAKGAQLSVDKSNTDADNIVAVGDPVIYTIRTTVPYIDSANLTTETYVVSDEITGADYDLNAVNAENKKIASIVFEDGTQMPDTVIFAQGTGDKEHTFEVNLKDVLNVANSNAGKTILITYQAKITDIDNIKNTARAGHKTNEVVDSSYGENDDDVFTGQITITKQDAANTGTKLAGAGFEVTKDSSTTPLNFTKVYVKDSEGKNTEVVDYYKYDPQGPETTVVTAGTAGVATIKGLDIGTYHFKEVVAPTGYSINADSVNGTITKSGTGKVTSAEQITFTGAIMSDTTLSALPSTGGIGTTIFTVGGCAIMILAAGLYFALRRKTEK